MINLGMAAASTYVSGDDAAFNILTPFVVGAIVFALVYVLTYLYYRNTDKSYDFERKTDIRIANVQAFDHAGRRRNGVHSSIMSGRNNGSPRERVNRVALEPQSAPRSE